MSITDPTTEPRTEKTSDPLHDSPPGSTARPPDKDHNPPHTKPDAADRAEVATTPGEPDTATHAETGTKSTESTAHSLGKSHNASHSKPDAADLPKVDTEPAESATPAPDADHNTTPNELDTATHAETKTKPTESTTHSPGANHSTTPNEPDTATHPEIGTKPAASTAYSPGANHGTTPNEPETATHPEIGTEPAELTAYSLDANHSTMPSEPDAVCRPRVGAESVGSPAARANSRNGFVALAMRLHFYAGVFVGPFILIAAITGALYSISPTIESIVNHNLLHVDSSGPAKPLADQVGTAVALEPKLVLAAVDPAQHSGDTTRVLFNDPSLGESEQRAVFVDPATATSVGVSVVYGSTGSLPLRTWIDQLHRNLHLGQAGRLYSETAASWMWIIALAGLVLWVRRAVGRRGGPRRLLWPDRSRTGRSRTVNWHAAVGMWVLLPVLFLSATGMTWSTYAGAHVDALRAQLSWTSPSVNSTLPGSDTRAGVSSSMPGMESSMPGMDMSAGASAAAQPLPADRIAELDKVFAVTRGHHIDGPVEITVPTTDHTAFVVKERRISGVLTQDAIAVDGTTGDVTDTVRYASWPLMAKLANWGIALHMGMMFGLANQLLLLVTMLALITVIVRGYRMWWQRRPLRAGRFALGTPPRRGVLRGIHPALLAGLVVITVAVGWFAPMLGITLAGFLIIDVIIGMVRDRRAEA